MWRFKLSLWDAGLDSVTALLRAREQEKRSHRVIQKITNEAGNTTIFTPIVLSASGAMGPSTVAFLKDVYARAKAAGKFNMKQQPDMEYTWNTMVASSYWDAWRARRRMRSSRTASSSVITP